MITPELLQRVGVRADRSKAWAPALEVARGVGEITTPLRAAHLLAQTLHESSALSLLVELWGPSQVPAQARYETRADLGNTQPGDGYRYRGRGPIQVTGRRNYAMARDELRQLGVSGVPDFEARPDDLLVPTWGALAAAAWWRRNGANKWADYDDGRAVSGLVNRGSPELRAMHLPERLALLAKCKTALSCAG